MIHPSPALIARADTSIADCVRMMNERNVGSILIVSDDSKAELVGIFTERDLLKHLDLIEGGASWIKPVRTVMTRPVKGIQLEQMEDAASIMIENGFRHLPVFLPGGGRILAGVISMRDLFKAMVADKKSEIPSLRETLRKLPTRGQYGILSSNSAFIEFVRKAVSKIRGFRLRILAESELEPRLLAEMKPQIQGLFLDLDDWKTVDWGRALLKLHRAPRMPRTVLFFDPAAHSPTARKILAKLGESGNFLIFAKPVDVVTLMSRVVDHLG